VTPEPELDAEERRLLAAGVEQFNRGLFFEAHDTLEELWSGIRGPSRDFFQGLIQTSVAFYHLGNGNFPGAASLFRRALRRFSPYPAAYFGFDLAGQRALVESWLSRVESGDVGDVRLEDLPKWTFAAAPGASGVE
jgi:predicted metal-dependent hydrolase